MDVKRPRVYSANERIDQLHRMYVAKDGEWETWRPTIEDAEYHVRELLGYLDNLQQRLFRAEVEGNWVCPDPSAHRKEPR